MRARFILSRKRVIEKYNELKEIADVISYSYKTNQEVGKLLGEIEDCFFSVHSIEDISGIKHPKRVWFFLQAPNKIGDLFQKGLRNFVVDNENDLTILLQYIQKNNAKISLLLRMKLKEHSIHTGKHYVYGMYSSRINELLPILRKNKKILKLGIHFHRKTQNVSEWSLKEELQETIAQENWKNIDLVNIGGGIPSDYKNTNASFLLKDIFLKIKSLREWLNSQGIKMIIEPGRYIASYPVKLEATILNVHENTIIINCSVYNSAMDTFIANVRLLVENEVDEGKKEARAYTIKGCTPDSMDIFRYRVFLKEKRPGEKIVFLNAGAYNFSTDFCSLPKLETVIVD